MVTIPYVKKKIGKVYLVWFQNSNSFLQLEEPAWFVFSKVTKRYKTETIAREFSGRYTNSLEDSLAFVTEIRSNINRMNLADRPKNQTGHNSKEINGHLFHPFSRHCYKLGQKLISFSFETRHFEKYIHPLVGHLETTENGEDMPIFELFSFQEKIIFRFNGEVKGIWERNESHLVKGMIFMFLINLLYDKTEEDWLMTVHASAITNGKKTILFSAPAGNGKTTIAALLQARGYRLISDDFVPVDRKNFTAFPVPIAMSVKPGSTDCLVPHFPELEQKALTVISPEKSVRYLPPDLVADFRNEVFPVRDFIFIHYDRSTEFVFEKLDPVKAIKLLLEQTWVAPTPHHVKSFFDKMHQSSFFKLTYSNNEKALEAIKQLFGHD